MTSYMVLLLRAMLQLCPFILYLETIRVGSGKKHDTQNCAEKKRQCNRKLNETFSAAPELAPKTQS